jgi:hypothetical protein
MNDHWEKLPLSPEDLKKIKPFLEWIKVLKQQDLTGFSIVASFLCHRVQPLKARERYGFKYAGAEDPSRMVPTQELTEEVLGWLRKMLKDASVAPLQVKEYTAMNSPPSVSYFYYFFASSFLLCFLCSILLFGYL